MTHKDNKFELNENGEYRYGAEIKPRMVNICGCFVILKGIGLGLWSYLFVDRFMVNEGCEADRTNPFNYELVEVDDMIMTCEDSFDDVMKVMEKILVEKIAERIDYWTGVKENAMSNLTHLNKVKNVGT